MADFLARSSVAIASTRDDDKVPHVHFLSGWSVDADGASVVCLFPEVFAEGLVERLERHPAVALTVEMIGPHECYQFKGRFRDARAATAGDRATFESCRERFVAAVKRLMGDRFPDRALRARFREPALAVRFAVDEIYVQTPGPTAGRKLFPTEAA